MAERTADPIVDVVARWHEHIAGHLPGGLDELLADDVVFHSPIVFTPQRGKEITKMYLMAAGGTLGGDAAPPGTTSTDEEARSDGQSFGGSFRYVKEVVQGHTALLEFETYMDGKYVNGIDLITCNDDGEIVEFKVMVRPLQAVNAVHAAMREALEAMS